MGVLHQLTWFTCSTILYDLQGVTSQKVMGLGERAFMVGSLPEYYSCAAAT